MSMVVGANADLYSPFPPLEDGPQSSEEGSGLHSPIFGAPFSSLHGDSSRHVRYDQDHLDIQCVTGRLTSAEFGYNPIHNVQRPHLGTMLEPPNSNALHRLDYRSDLTLPTRNQLGLDFPHLPTISRLPPPPAHSAPTDYSFQTSSERRLSGGQTHDPHYFSDLGSPAGMPMDVDHRSSSTSTDRVEYATGSPSCSREQRKEISVVVIACRQCRARKIRCDSTRPICNNCVRRSNECQYDAVPKRRGPDKRPGTRQRSCKKRPADGSAPPPPSKRKRTAAIDRAHQEELSAVRVRDDMTSPKRSLMTPVKPMDRSEDRLILPSSPPSRTNPARSLLLKDTQSMTPRRLPLLQYNSDSLDSRQTNTDVAHSQNRDVDNKIFPLSPSPSGEYHRKLWWDDLLRTYAPTREQSLKDIIADLSSLFSGAGYWLSFVNPGFLRSLYTDERLRIQPSFILAGLAMATLMKSSETELGSSGRDRASWLRNTAQTALESSWNSQWIDLSLAEAALILALFESSPHPEHTLERETSSLVFLDNIIRSLPLIHLDVHDPRVSTFGPHSVPTVTGMRSDTSKDSSRSFQQDRKCGCIPPNASLSQDHFSYWSYPPPWDTSWSSADIGKEECRRLCWNALNLVASYTSRCVLFNRKPPDLFLSNSANFAILFPGEAMDRASPSYRPSQVSSPKESVWALYCRSMLLWNFCMRLQNDKFHEEDKAEFALEAWAETQTLQDSLDMHVCNLNTALVYISREYICNCQIAIGRILRSMQSLDSRSSLGPDFNRKQAEEWLYYQDQAVKRINLSIHHLNGPQGYLLTRRPFQVAWFSSQLAICLSLWERDHTLVSALELAKSVLIPLDVLNALWPCPIYRARCNVLRRTLEDACTAVGLSLPSSAEFSLPPLLRSR